MDDKALERLQKLGIDVWVTHEHADELIRRGLAKSQVKPLSQKTSMDRDAALESRNRVPNYRSTGGGSNRPKTHSVSSVQRPVKPGPSVSTGIEKPNSKPVQIELAIYSHGSSVIVIHLNDVGSQVLRTDILKTLSNFEEHATNRYEYRFPYAGLKHSSPEEATLQAAQEGLFGMISKQSAKVASGTLLAVGEGPAAVSELLKNRVDKFITIDHLPQTVEEKQALWNQLTSSTP